MSPYLAVYDNFFSDVELTILKGIILYEEPKDIVSPTDGITYPGIIPVFDAMKEYLKARLNSLCQQDVVIGEVFMRLTSSQQKEAPNKVHNDASMGTHAALIYVTEEWPVGAGTSFWTHETEGEIQTAETDAALVQSHTNNFAKWQRRLLVQGKHNRILLYDARLYHCAEPVGGFGKDKHDGRIVLTVFFNLKEK